MESANTNGGNNAIITPIYVQKYKNNSSTGSKKSGIPRLVVSSPNSWLGNTEFDAILGTLPILRETDQRNCERTTTFRFS